MTVIHPSRNIVWSTDHLDLSDPFQRRWYLRQVLTHGRAKDIHELNLEEVADELDGLGLPEQVYSLWKTFLEAHHASG
jgi:hypothetical protein